jgi:two-component system sensor histidine kinase HydH
MKSHLAVRITAPIMAISLLPLAVGIVTAWHVHRSQKEISDDLAYNVISMRAAEEIAIGIRDVRTQLDHFLFTGDRKCLEAIPALRQETDHWLAEAARSAVTDREHELIASIRHGYAHFWGEFDRVLREPATADLPRQMRELNNDALTNEILNPAQEFLDYNEEQIAKNSEDNQAMADHMVFGLALLGVCGPVAGLLAGYGIARGLSRSFVRLSLPIRDAAGKLNEVVGPVSFSADLGLEELEAVLQRMADQVGAVVNRLQQSQREALRAEQLAAVGQMAAGMAHELRNPLTSMKILVQAASGRGLPASLEGRDLAVLEDEITRLEDSIRTFLDFARPPQPEKRPLDAREAIQQITTLVSGRATQQGVEVTVTMPPEPVLIRADQGQIRQVVLNLLLNALDAVAPGGSIQVRLSGPDAGTLGFRPSRRPKRLRLTVADTGCGLPSDLGEQIFEPFVSTKVTGIGLGLSICKRIVEAHDGEIQASNRPRGGALFTVRLPLAAQPEPYPGPALAAPTA